MQKAPEKRKEEFSAWSWAVQVGPRLSMQGFDRQNEEFGGEWRWKTLNAFKH